MKEEEEEEENDSRKINDAKSHLSPPLLLSLPLNQSSNNMHVRTYKSIQQPLTSLSALIVMIIIFYF